MMDSVRSKNLHEVSGFKEVPSGWSKSSLSDISRISIGGTPSRAVAKYWATGSDAGYPWVAISDLKSRSVIKTKERITSTGVKSSNVKLVPSNTLIMSFKLSIGRIAYAGSDLYTNEAIAAFHIDDEIIDVGFLFYQLPIMASGLVTDAAIKGATLNKEKLNRLDILYPPLEQQKKIAKILSTVDNLIEQTQALIDKYTAIKQGMMADLFTRGIDLSGTPETNPNHGQLRPTFEEAPELYKETELGWIPREWEVCTLGSLLKSIDAGWSPNCPEIRPSTGQWGVLKVSAVTRGFYEPSEAKTLPIGLEPDTSIEVKNGDVIMTRANGVAELVGLTVQVIDSPKKLMLSDKLLRLNPNFKVITKNYLLLVMNSNSIRTQIVKRLSGSSGQRNISQSEIKKFKVCCGSTGEQMIITKNVYALSNKIKLEKKLANKLQKQKKGLMQDLLTGKVRVNP